MDPFEEPHAELARKRVGMTLRRKYRLDALLGVGGMGAVYRATHRNGSVVAIKVLDPLLSRLADVKSRFLREGYAANKVGHAGAVHVIDDDDDSENGAVFLVLELLEGSTVGARAAEKGGRLELEEVLDVTDRLLDTLSAAHGSGVVHRDIKPDNLFVTQANRLKVLDFGIARVFDGTSATKTGQILGTPAFMAPEQAAGRISAIDGRTDLWAVGATMFTLLTGQHVHEAATGVLQMVLSATQPARLVSSVLPDLPTSAASIIDRALAFDQSARWQDAATMRHAVNAARQPEPEEFVPDTNKRTLVQGSGG